MKSFTKIFISIAAIAVVFGIITVATNDSTIPFAPEYAFALGTGGCGGCGDGSSGGSPGNGGDGFTTIVFGCTDPSATNYKASATHNNGSCTYPPKEGCTDIFADNYDITAKVDDGSCTYPPVVVTTCKLTASATTIENGGSVTLTWETEGFETIKINGQTVTGKNGSKTFTNITVNTTYTLVATNSNGDRCQTTVDVKCLPPVVKECELDIHKTVNKSTAKVGDQVTYTITVKNTGTADCTGGGVRIFDVVDGNLVYKSHTLTSNLTAGYGNQPVYSSSDRTLRFNGNTLTPGESGTITWIGQVSNPTQCGDFVVKNQAKTTAKELNDFQTWVYSETVKTNIDNDCIVDKPLPKCDYFTAAPNTFEFGGGNTTLKWETTDATSVSISGIGSVNVDNTAGRVVPVTATQTFVLTATNANGVDNSCVQTVTVKPKVDVPLPVCDSFTASPSNILVGGKSTLSWNTTNAVQVFLNPGNTAVSVDGTFEVSPIVDTTYVLTVIGAEDKTVDCSVPVKVSEDQVPVCKNFTASPSSLPVGGGNVTLNWEVTDASSVSIAPTVGAVGLTGSRSVNVTQGTTYVLTATDTNGDQTTCSAPVAVADPSPVFTCEQNVNFSVTDSSIRRGDTVTLNWSTVDVDTVSISTINKTSLSGSEAVSPSSDITYTLTATQGSRTVYCPVSVDVSSGGGGGGGSATPRCDLDISDSKINAGEEVTLRWDTSNAGDLRIEDDRGNEIFTTEDFLNKEKDDYFDGSIKVRPTRDTEYTLTVERGSKDRECTVDVEVDKGNVVVLQTRDQQPLVAGISLTQVPYTGFEAGPFMTTLFYLLLVAWSLFVTYLLVIRNRVVASPVKMFTPSTEETSKESMKRAESIRPDVFAQSVMTKVSASQTAPANLPTGMPIAGHQVMKTTVAAQSNESSDTVATEIENRAHSQKALLSSDAVRHFISVSEDSVERDEALDQVIAEAKKTYPLEDGWLVLNQARMQGLCETCFVAAKVEVVAASTGSGSLAEAIVTGNVVAAYEMIGHRPMLALADAAADLDAVYRNRKGGSNSVSDMLSSETQNLSDEQITEMISALTGALDGTYTDEASAVKMSIMKAVKVVA
jgi:uncharacterized repeat protein (TIGR01451 family)